MGKNKHIPSGERTIILRVMHFFEEEKKKGFPLLPLKKALSRASCATGFSLSTMTRLKREELKYLQENSSTTSPESTSKETTSSSTFPKRPDIIFPTTRKKRPPPHNKIKIDDHTVIAIKEIVDNFYKQNNEMPTIKKILAVAKADLNFPGQKETLRKILNERCGYTFTKCPKRNEMLKGRSDVGFWRKRKSKIKKEQKGILKREELQSELNKMSSDHNGGIGNEQNEFEILTPSVQNEFDKIINVENAQIKQEHRKDLNGQ